ncbi:hypothetical protein ACGFZJ_14680 [Streptomyces sp. NPDC048253]|uniref:hypothetical protein n=1 Tax=Streptomyces sp. NPDC048253 TaxID=3365524 RepID=UPI003724B8BB
MRPRPATPGPRPPAGATYGTAAPGEPVVHRSARPPGGRWPVGVAVAHDTPRADAVPPRPADAGSPGVRRPSRRPLTDWPGASAGCPVVTHRRSTPPTRTTAAIAVPGAAPTGR